MVSTLRITSIAVFLLAGLVVLLVAGPSSLVPNLLAGFALQNDPEIERILNEPGVVDRWKEAHGDSVGTREETTPALIREAEAFKNILDPPPLPVAEAGKTGLPPGRKPPVIKPVPSSAKFALVGTTVSIDNSFAYIRLQDKSYQWARIGDEIGHLTIKEIRKGSIVCWDGHAEVEMSAEEVPETASLLEATGPSVTRASLDPGSTLPAGGRITGQPVARPWTSGLSPAEGDEEMNEEEREAVDDLVDRLRELKQNAPATLDANMAPEDRDEAVKKLIAEFKSSRVSPEEAEKVEDLGRELNESAEPSPANKLRDVRRKLTIPRAVRK